jgi:pyrroline-5-carboxylate reductase
VISGTLWLVGCGNMGGAMLRRWIAAGLDPGLVLVIDSGAPVVPAGVRLVATPPAEPAPDILVLAVKPQQLDDVAPSFLPWRGAAPLILSILAGSEAATLRARLAAPAVIRAMPNLPVSIGKGVVALWSDSASDAQRAMATTLAEPLGIVEWLHAEDQFHAIIALPGSGPGFVFRILEALEKGAIAQGLPADQARRLAVATVAGAAALAAQSGEDPHLLAARVASKGGTTQAGLDVLDEDGAIDRLIAQTMAAAARRSAELAEAAR